MDAANQMEVDMAMLSIMPNVKAKLGGNATAADFYRVMQDVAEKVKQQFGVTLEPEVRLLGEFPA